MKLLRQSSGWNSANPEAEHALAAELAGERPLFVVAWASRSKCSTFGAEQRAQESQVIDR